MALDRFQQLLQGRLQQAQAQNMMEKEAFERQKYNDLIQRQKMQDEAVQNELLQQQQAAQLIPNALLDQEDAFFGQGPYARSQFQPDPQMAIQSALTQGAGNPAAMDAVTNYANLIKSTTPKTAADKSPTDLTNFVNYKIQAFKEKNNGQEPPAEDVSRWWLEGRRAQAPEQFAVLDAKEEVKKKRSYPKVRGMMKSLNRQWDIVDKTVDEAIALVSPFTAGVGAWTAVVPASKAKTLQSKLDTLRANIGFDKLQDMRNNSPTGGALGQVSELELQLLQAVKAGVEQNLAPAQLKENLLRIKQDFQLMRQDTNDSFTVDYANYIPETTNQKPQKTIVRTGRTRDNRKVIEYSDGTREVQ